MQADSQLVPGKGVGPLSRISGRPRRTREFCASGAPWTRSANSASEAAWLRSQWSAGITTNRISTGISSPWPAAPQSSTWPSPMGGPRSGFYKTTTWPVNHDDRVTSAETNIATGSAVIPILVYHDIEAAHDFLVGVFGFSSGGLHRSADGTVVHGEVRLGEEPIWLHMVTAEHDMCSPQGTTGSHGGLSVIVDDVDVHYARSKAAGARIDSPPTDQDYGLREYGVQDPENHRWWFSTPIR